MLFGEAARRVSGRVWTVRAPPQATHSLFEMMCFWSSRIERASARLFILNWTRFRFVRRD